MHRIIILIGFSLFAQGNEVLAQEELTVQKIQALANQEKVVVHVSALWCLPCVKKLRVQSDSLLLIHDTSMRHIVVFDRLSYSKARVDKLKIIFFDSSSIFVIPMKYYSKAWLQFNPSNKVLKKYMSALYAAFPGSEKKPGFWFGNNFTVENRRLSFLEE